MNGSSGESSIGRTTSGGGGWSRVTALAPALLRSKLHATIDLRGPAFIPNGEKTIIGEFGRGSEREKNKDLARLSFFLRETGVDSRSSVYSTWLRYA